MNPTEVGALITGSAAFAGVVAGGGMTWLVTFSAGRRQRADARHERRHGAYAAFIGAAEELTRLLTAHDTLDRPPALGSVASKDLSRAVGSVDRAYVGVLLAGPEKAQAAAEAVGQEARRVVLFIAAAAPKKRGLDTDYMERMGGLVGGYMAACGVFAGVARDVLGNSGG